MIYCVSDQGLASIARSTAVAVVLCFGPAGVAPANESGAPAPISSPSASSGEFDNNSALELESGQTIKTDCSINWTSGDGKIYCFSTPEAKETFLKSPQDNIQKAREFYVGSADKASGAAKNFTEDDAVTDGTARRRPIGPFNP